MFGLCMRNLNLLFVDSRDVEWRLGLRRFWLDMNIHIPILPRREFIRRLLKKLRFLMILLELRMEGIFLVLLRVANGDLLDKGILRDISGTCIMRGRLMTNFLWMILRQKIILVLV